MSAVRACRAACSACAVQGARVPRVLLQLQLQARPITVHACVCVHLDHDRRVVLASGLEARVDRRGRDAVDRGDREALRLLLVATRARVAKQCGLV